VFYDKLQGAIAPGLRNSQYAYRDKLGACLKPELRWLDLGCGHNLLPAWMPNALEDERALAQRVRQVVGIDADFPNLRVHGSIRQRALGDIERLPFADASFGLVTANMVVEHVADPARLLAEVNRVLERNGTFLFHTPNYWGYTTVLANLFPDSIKVFLAKWLQNRASEDVFPTHYRLNTRSSVEQVCSRNNFEIADLSFAESSAQTVMLGPLVGFELLWIRLLRWRPLAGMRTNLVVELRKREEPPASNGTWQKPNVREVEAMGGRRAS
jgi:SAM-dependent methyltransferase